MHDFMRDFDELLPPSDFETVPHQYFPLTFNDDFFYPVKEKPEVVAI